MSSGVSHRRAGWPTWAARIAVATVCAWNLSAAVPLTVSPHRYIAGFEVSGTGGEALVRGLGILFLMWQVPFLPVIWNPCRHRVCLRVILAMQAMGLAGELWMIATLPSGHAALRTMGARFVAFDAAGLILLAAAYVLTRGARPV